MFYTAQNAVFFHDQCIHCLHKLQFSSSLRCSGWNSANSSYSSCGYDLNAHPWISLDCDKKKYLWISFIISYTSVIFQKIEVIFHFFFQVYLGQKFSIIKRKTYFLYINFLWNGNTTVQIFFTPYFLYINVY